jgi:hypothetical protein
VHDAARQARRRRRALARLTHHGGPAARRRELARPFNRGVGWDLPAVDAVRRVYGASMTRPQRGTTQATAPPAGGPGRRTTDGPPKGGPSAT